MFGQTEFFKTIIQRSDFKGLLIWRPCCCVDLQEIRGGLIMCGWAYRRLYTVHLFAADDGGYWIIPVGWQSMIQIIWRCLSKQNRAQLETSGWPSVTITWKSLCLEQQWLCILNYIGLRVVMSTNTADSNHIIFFTKWLKFHLLCSGTHLITFCTFKVITNQDRFVLPSIIKKRFPPNSFPRCIARHVLHGVDAPVQHTSWKCDIHIKCFKKTWYATYPMKRPKSKFLAWYIIPAKKFS